MSEKTVFISYRRDATGKYFARSIEGALTHHGYDVFLDVDCIDAGEWAEQILTEVPKRAHFLLLLTPGALDRCADETDWVRREFLLALERGRNIVPVREESVDLAAMRAAAPEAVKAIFDFQIHTIQHGTFESDVETLTTRYIPPHKAPKEGIPKSTRLPSRHLPHHQIRPGGTHRPRGRDQAPHRRLGPRPCAASRSAPTSSPSSPSAARGRPRWWRSGRRSWRIRTGRGATPSSRGPSTARARASRRPLRPTCFSRKPSPSSATRRWRAARRARSTKAGGWPSSSASGGRCSSSMAWSRCNTRPPRPRRASSRTRASPPCSKGWPPANHGLCVVTTRYSIPDLRAYWQTTAPEVKLPRLSKEAGVALLRSLGVKGTPKEFEKLVEDVQGHALTLNLLGTYLHDAHAGDIRKRDLVKLEEADAEEQGGHAFRVMDAYVQWFESEGEKGKRALAVLRLLGLFDRPATADCLAALLKAPGHPGLTEALVGMSEAQRNVAFTRLEAAKLLTVNRDAAGTLLSLDAHPLLREYFARQLRTQHPEAWRAAHRRLYEHLCATTPDKPSPHSKTSNRSTKPWPTAARRGCSRRRVTRFTDARILRGQDESTARRNSARSVPTWEPSPASSSNRGAASRPRSRKPTKPGC